MSTPNRDRIRVVRSHRRTWSDPSPLTRRRIGSKGITQRQWSKQSRVDCALVHARRTGKRSLSLSRTPEINWSVTVPVSILWRHQWGSVFVYFWVYDCVFLSPVGWRWTERTVWVSSSPVTGGSHHRDTNFSISPGKRFKLTLWPQVKRGDWLQVFYFSWSLGNWGKWLSGKVSTNCTNL